MKKVYIENEHGSLEKTKVEYGVFMGADDKNMKMNVIGESTFEQMNDLVLSGLKHLYEAATHALGGKTTKKQIYERAVQMFSLLMDEFYPEGKDAKYGLLTDKDIKEAEDRKIELLHKQRQD